MYEMNFIKKNIANIILTGFLYSINMVIGIFTSRILGPDGIGHFQVFSSTQSIIATLFSLGLGQASIYFINNKGYQINFVVTTLIKYFIPASLFTFVVVSLIIYFKQDYFGETERVALILFSAGTCALLFTTSLRAILVADLNIRKLQLVQYSSQTLILSIIVLIYFGKISFSVDKLLIIYAIANIFSATLLVYYFKSFINWKLKFQKTLFKELVKLGSVMSGSNLVQVLFINSPVYALTWLWINGFEEVGYYSRALTITSIATFTIQAIGPLLYAKLSKGTKEQIVRQTKITATAFFIFNFLMFTIIEVFAGIMVRLLYGEAFIPAASYLRIISFSMFFNGMMSVALNTLSSVGKASKVLKSLLLGIIALWISIIIVSLAKESLLIAYCVVFSNIVTALALAYETTKIMPLTIWDYIPTKKSQITNVFSVLKSGLK